VSRPKWYSYRGLELHNNEPYLPLLQLWTRFLNYT